MATETERFWGGFGSPAFPIVVEGGSDSGLTSQLSAGMTLRDWFASHAPSVPQYYHQEKRPQPEQSDYAEAVLKWEASRRAIWNYIYADAMLIARNTAYVSLPQDVPLYLAAPDMLAACQEFVRKVEAGEARSTRSYKQMKDAIAKALGPDQAAAPVAQGNETSGPEAVKP